MDALSKLPKFWTVFEIEYQPCSGTRLLYPDVTLTRVRQGMSYARYQNVGQVNYLGKIPRLIGIIYLELGQFVLA